MPISPLPEDSATDLDILPIPEDVKPHVDRLLKNAEKNVFESQLDATKAITSLVYEDHDIADGFAPAGSIRHVTMVAKVTKFLMMRLGFNPDAIRLMTIGSIDLPDQYRAAVRRLLLEGQRYELEIFDERGPGYDLPAMGDLKTRRRVIDRLDRSYGFSDHGISVEHMADVTAFVAGGMQGLHHAMLALTQVAPVHGKKVRFLHPDSRFGTYGTMARRLTFPTYGPHSLQPVDSLLGEVHEIPTKQEDGFHLTPDSVWRYRGEHDITGDKHLNVWCVAPLSNPAATLMKDIRDTLEVAVRGDENAVVLVDNVYMGMMGSRERSKEVMAEILGDRELRRQVIFVESASKEFALCRKRVGLLFAFGNQHFPVLMNTIMTITAGSGLDKDGIWRAIAEMDDKQQAEFAELHEFWGRERHGLFHYLMNEHGRLFHDDQSHLKFTEFEGPFGLYVFLRIKDDIAHEQVFAETGCFGVPVDLDGGKYIRFAVGMLTEPTFQQYIPADHER